MYRFNAASTLQLVEGELKTWHQARAVRLVVRSGLLWVTCANDLTDHFLRPGDSLLLPRRTLACIGALAGSELRVEPVEVPTNAATSMNAALALTKQLAQRLSRLRSAWSTRRRPGARRRAATFTR
jgi:hypothetical protein